MADQPAQPVQQVQPQIVQPTRPAQPPVTNITIWERARANPLMTIFWIIVLLAILYGIYYWWTTRSKNGEPLSESGTEGISRTTITRQTKGYGATGGFY